MKRAIALLGLMLAATVAVATLPSSGPITLANLQLEFGGSTPTSITEYYRGGGRVPDTAPNAAIPTSGQISLSNFYGASAGVIVNPLNIAAACYAPLGSGAVGCMVVLSEFGTAGTYGLGTDNTVTTPSPSNWYTPYTAGVGASYWAIASVTSGSLFTNDLITCTQLVNNGQGYFGPRLILYTFNATGSATFTLTIYSDASCSTAVMQTTGNTLTQTVS